MLLFSWNVAGFSSTVHRIHANYSNDCCAASTATTTSSISSGCAGRAVVDLTSSTDDDCGNDNDDDGTGERDSEFNSSSTDCFSAMIDVDRKRPTSNTSSRKKRKPTTTGTAITTANTDSTTNASKQQRTNVLSYYFQRHGGADIICLQEHKISASQLQNHMEPYQCASLHTTHSSTGSSPTTPPQQQQQYFYESFWSCCTDPQSKGFNGVVTYVKCHRRTNDNDTTINDNSNNHNDWTTTVISANGTSCFPPSSDGNDTDDFVILNQQGRCVITEHGPPSTPAAATVSSTTATTNNTGFILFNVYVPCHGTVRKMKFLHALQNSMQYQRRTKQKPIILVGDLNIAHQPLDISHVNRIVYINEILQEVQQQQHESSQPSLLPQWKVDIATHWSTIVQIVQSTKRVVPTTTTNSSTGTVYHKFRCVVTVPLPVPPSSAVATSVADGCDDDDDAIGNSSPATATTNQQQGRGGRDVYLGNHESTSEYCLEPYEFLQRQMYYDERTQMTRLLQEANTPTVKVLVELMNKLIFHNSSATSNNNNGWDDTTIQEIADTVGTVNRDAPSRLWLQSLLDGGDDCHSVKMIDTFRYLYPTAIGRFTCWNQNTNGRYVNNNGCRIDYTLMDESLLPYLERGGETTTLRCGSMAASNNKNERNNDKNTTSKFVDPDDTLASSFAFSEEGAISAITANGRYQPAPYNGAGIIEADRSTLDTQFGVRHTGHVYTPPTYSDHIAVSLLLNDTVAKSSTVSMNEVRSPSTLLWNDSTTRKSQPHKQQPTIGSFFQKSSVLSNNKHSNKNSSIATTTTSAALLEVDHKNSSEKFEIAIAQTSTRRTSMTTGMTNRSGGSISDSKKSNQQHRRTKKVQPPPPNSVWYHFSTKEKK